MNEDLSRHLDAGLELSLDDSERIRAWASELAQFGKPTCVRAAVAAAREALAVWEKLEPWSRAPHDRIAAAEAWLTCQCVDHAEAAGDLAWANGDDSPLKLTSLVVEGRSIEPIEAIYAHWSSDNAASSAWCANARIASEVCGTGMSAAIAALEKLEIDHDVRARRILHAVITSLRT